VSEPGISIIIPTYDNWPLLHRTIAATLADCRMLALSWEVLIVDNESCDEAIQQIEQFVGRDEPMRLISRRGLNGFHFQPGAARNVGIEAARYDRLVFLDADCIPGPELVRTYADLLEGACDTVLVGHREFVDLDGLDASELAAQRSLLDAVPRVCSSSNYGQSVDRRMPELLALDCHPRPYDCMYSCNFAIHRGGLGSHRFDPIFDGYWGYEDIELGYRLHMGGCRFRYVPSAYVYHQEPKSVCVERRSTDRARNFELAASMIPGFSEYRKASARVGAFPNKVSVPATPVLECAFV